MSNKNQISRNKIAGIIENSIVSRFGKSAAEFIAERLLDIIGDNEVRANIRLQALNTVTDIMIEKDDPKAVNQIPIQGLMDLALRDLERQHAITVSEVNEAKELN